MHLGRTSPVETLAELGVGRRATDRFCSHSTEQMGFEGKLGLGMESVRLADVFFKIFFLLFLRGKAPRWRLSDRRLLNLLVSEGGYFLFPSLLECFPYADHNHRHVCSSVISKHPST